MWDQRYSSETYAYGTEPNDFLVSMFDKLPAGKILCIGEGEGRNAVWMARHGRDVTAVDSSEVGLAKANKLAKARGVNITTVHKDLADFDIGVEQWDAIVSIFCHLPPTLRADVHQRCKISLRQDGILLLEAYTPLQLEYKTGGPPAADMMMDVQTLSDEFRGMEFLHLQEHLRVINEGQFHNGTGTVVQMLARKL